MTDHTPTPFDLDWASVEGADWVQHDARLSAEFAGLWVVARDGRIAGRGPTPEAAQAEAAAALGLPAHTLLACALSHPDQWSPDA
jgi:hypothetical protein